MKALQKEVSNDPYLDFLTEAGWEKQKIYPLGADMGARQYFYIGTMDKGALLMDMSRGGKESGLDYFLKISTFLNKEGVKAPEIYHYDQAKGLALIEYLGDDSFGDAMRGGQDEKVMYDAAADILIQLRYNIPHNDMEVPVYAATGIRQRVRQFVDYYVPAVTDITPSEELVQEMESMWAQIEENMPPPVNGFCHADYHLENIMWRPWGKRHNYGLIDFQDAFWGPQAYDLVNLLRDARKTVPEDIQQSVLTRYCAGMSTEDKESFDAWFALLSAHFHCRVIGLFIKFSHETGTDKFLAHIPRLQGYLRENLKNPLLAPLKEFCEAHSISFDKTPTT